MNPETFKPDHFAWSFDGRVATINLNRPERKNPLTLQSYAELRDTFRRLLYVPEVRTVVFKGSEGNFCSGGDVHDIIGPLVKMEMPELLEFTRMTGDLVKAMRACPQPIIAAIDGICAGAGACIAMAADMRYGTARAKVAFLFVRVGLAGCDMGACAMLPRIIGQGRASELFYTGRLAQGPTFAHAMTKKALHQEWTMGVDEAIEAEAEAQAICMQTGDFTRAYEAFVKKEKPVFEGN
jgi:enoyl-CoA hydratase/carnithine racemase